MKKLLNIDRIFYYIYYILNTPLKKDTIWHI